MIAWAFVALLGLLFLMKRLLASGAGDGNLGLELARGLLEKPELWSRSPHHSEPIGALRDCSRQFRSGFGHLSAGNVEYAIL
jgi:hypothetical protein